MNPSSQIPRNLELNNCFASVFHDSVNYTIPDQLNELSIKMITLDFSLFDILLLLEPTDYFSATGDELPSFLFNQWSNIICSPDFELFFWMPFPAIIFPGNEPFITDSEKSGVE